MSRSHDGTNDFLDFSGDPAGGNTLTLHVWLNPTNFTAASHPFVIGVSGSLFNNNRLEIKVTTGNVVAATRGASGGSSEAQASAALSAGVWNAVTAVFAASNDRRCFVNGANKGTNTGAPTAPTGQNLTRIGAGGDGSVDYAGLSAHAAIWNVALTDEEVEMLGAHRVSPLSVRPASLKAYWRHLGRDSPEIDVVGGNNFTVSGATVSADDPPVLWMPFKRKIFLPAAVAPTFDSAATVQSQTSAAYTIAYDADANATNIYVGAYPKDATAPTAAELKAGTGAHGTATEATTGSSDTIVLTPTDSPAFPLYDVYAVLEGSGGFSSVVALVDEFLDPPAGKQFQTLGTVSGTSPLAGASPAVASGDIWVLDTVSIEDGYTITPTNTGDYSMDRGGDTSRQSFEHDVYDVSLAAYYGEGTVYDGNNPPNFTGGEPFFNGTVYKKDTNQGTIDISPSWSDVEGDSITFDVSAGALPTDWSLASNGQITGTPTVYGTYTPTFRATDSPPGDSGTSADSVVIGDEAPNVVGMLPAAAETAVEAVANFTVFSPSLEDYSDSIPAGQIMAQTPEAGTYVADDTQFTLTESLGPEPEDETIGGIQGKRRRRYFVEIDGQSFEVRSQAQAQEILSQAKEVAESHAEQMAKAVVRTQRGKGNKPVKLATPKISSPNAELKSAVSETRKAINATYRRAAMEAEIAFLMAQKAEQDEEETILLLM